MSIINLFPTKIYTYQIEEYEQVQQEIGNVINSVDFRQANERVLYTTNITDVRFNVIEQYGLHHTSAMIDKHIANYCAELGFPMRPYHIYSWFTKTKLGNYINTHHHNDTDIAGTYYFKTNGNDGTLFFESPVGPAPHSLPYSAQHVKAEFPPVQGRVVLFPGWMAHGVLKNTTDDDRIGLSFNIGFLR